MPTIQLTSAPGSGLPSGDSSLTVNEPISTGNLISDSVGSSATVGKLVVGQPTVQLKKKKVNVVGLCIGTP